MLWEKIRMLDPNKHGIYNKQEINMKTKKTTRKPAKKTASKVKPKTADNAEKSLEDNQNSITKPDEKPS